MNRLLRLFCSLLSAALLLSLAGEIGALALDLLHARLVGAGLALCLGLALAAARPAWLNRVGLAAGLLAWAAFLLPLGRLAARWGTGGYEGLLGALFACAALALGAALSWAAPVSPAAAADRRSRASGRWWPSRRRRRDSPARSASR